jgi:hypothetical protein
VEAKNYPLALQRREAGLPVPANGLAQVVSLKGIGSPEAAERPIAGIQNLHGHTAVRFGERVNFQTLTGKDEGHGGQHTTR